jgi:hypothetical protein
MPSLTFTARNRKNKGLIFNEKEILALYFYGIDIVNRMGTQFDRETIEFFVRAAQEEIEKQLTIKLVRQVFDERSDYYQNEFYGRGFVKTKFPVAKPITLDGYLGDQKQISYPSSWLTSNQSGDTPTSRQVVIVPNSSVSDFVVGAAVYGGAVIPYLGLINSQQIGSYFYVKYITGFPVLSLPFDLMDVVGKLASIGLFNILGDIVLGQAALASYSLSIDGLSQSINTTNSAENSAFSARIKMYKDEIKNTMKKLSGVYKGITLTAM